MEKSTFERRENFNKSQKRAMKRPDTIKVRKNKITLLLKRKRRQNDKFDFYTHKKKTKINIFL